jgi:PmbA protein
VSAAQRGTSVFFDLVVLAGEGERAAEFHAELRRRRLLDLHVERVVAVYSAFALHTLNANPPPSYRGPVIVSGEAAAQLFNPLFFNASPFVAHTSARLTQQHMSRFTPGELVTPEAPRGDTLTLVSDPTRPWGTRASSFDDEGLPATRVTLIEDGVFRDFWADARYASYLDVPPTGDIGNLNVRLGATPARALRATPAGPVYEIVAFSWFNPDALTGDFSAEIRLGYRHDATGVTPIKGGALTGNLFAAFGDARFSAEPFTDGIYYGPAAIRFGDLTIAGE